MSFTAFSTFAVLSINAGTFPDPTPKAGVPALYAALTIGVLPVASITAISFSFISVSVPCNVGIVMHCINPFGAPALSAAFVKIRSVSIVQVTALG